MVLLVYNLIPLIENVHSIHCYSWNVKFLLILSGASVYSDDIELWYWFPVISFLSLDPYLCKVKTKSLSIRFENPYDKTKNIENTLNLAILDLAFIGMSHFCVMILISNCSHFPREKIRLSLECRWRKQKLNRNHNSMTKMVDILLLLFNVKCAISQLFWFALIKNKFFLLNVKFFNNFFRIDFLMFLVNCHFILISFSNLLN